MYEEGDACPRFPNDQRKNYLLMMQYTKIGMVISKKIAIPIVNQAHHGKELLSTKTNRNNHQIDQNSAIYLILHNSNLTHSLR